MDFSENKWDLNWRQTFEHKINDTEVATGHRMKQIGDGIFSSYAAWGSDWFECI